MRLITRANIDGVACAVLVSTMENIEQIVFTNPKDIEDGSFFVRPGDAIANLPFSPKATLWFDHHEKAVESLEEHRLVAGKRGAAPSAARLVYEYYNSPRLEKYSELLSETDRIDSAQLTVEDVLNPRQWVLLSCTLDPFNDLPAYHDYVLSVIFALKSGASIDYVLDLTEVKARVNRYLLDADDFRDDLRRVSHIDDNVIVTDFRKVELMPIGNRFLAFAMYPEANVQIRIYPHDENNKLRIRLGKSLFNRTCNIPLGKLAAKFGGGGLEGAAGLVLDNDEAEQVISDIITTLKANALDAV